MNPKFVVVGVVSAFAIIIAIIGFSGSTIIDDISGGEILSPSELPRTILPLEIQLKELSVLEVTDTTATLEIQFKVTNPNLKSVILQMINYELYENNVRVKRGQIGERPVGMVEASNYFIILPEQPTILKDKITIKNTGNFPEFWSALVNNTPQWKIKGGAFFNLSSITSGEENEITFEFTK